MRWAQIQFHGTYKENAELLTSQAAADSFKLRLPLNPQRTASACVYVPSGCQSGAWGSKASARPPAWGDWAASRP